ncbi:winged-helix domain-containing protein [Methylocapsa aurea]|uniref:winged-helix domain-containing protein n=1 Tax=Methylocapsa aurea TaxID=663610 RepID=UPI00056839EE|nr:winged-helix domain-containing protein [Methylocapsa aurea]
MDTSIELIRTKIAELEAKIADLRIAERELQALEKPPARKTRLAPGPKPKRKPAEKPTEKPEPSEEGAARQTIGAAIANVLGQHGALSVGEIADLIKATGRDITNRTISFSLQALKKRGLVKGADGKWSLPKTRSRQSPS